MSTAREQLQTFTLDSIPTLDVAVMGALELFAEHRPPKLPRGSAHPLVVGSVNAHTTGTILYADRPAVFATESTVHRVLERYDTIDGAVLISASGGKHAVGIAEILKQRGIKTTLLTNNPHPPAAVHIAEEDIVVFPKNREPYTYNTSTYFGMILAKTGEDAETIQSHLEREIMPRLDLDFGAFNAFTFIVPSRFEQVVAMMRTKFDELFGPFVAGRVFTEEEIKHAKTIVTSHGECFIGLGVTNGWYGVPANRLTLPLPEPADFAAVLAIGYAAIGAIQQRHKPYFANNIAEYAKRVSEMFGHEIPPIVE